ncbi:MAG: helicase HerA-like domain-containing protein [Polyangiaceae bacterium]
MPTRPLHLGRTRPTSGTAAPASLELPAHHFVTHAAVVGMTGSGKTGLVMVLVEEALRSRVPVLMVDIKGDLPNLLLSFPELAGKSFEPWVDAMAAEREGTTPLAVGEDLAKRAKEGLAGWGLGQADIAAFREKIAPRILTPGTTAGEPIHVLSALESPSPLWQEDEESARDALSASISLLLRLVERDADPAKSRDHVMLSHLAERRLASGRPAGLTALLQDLIEPPIQTIGAMAVDDFLSPKERKELAQELNALVASPTFAAWQKGAPLDVGAWLSPRDGKTPAVIVSVAHLDDQERALVLGLLFDQILAWVRSLPGTSDLRALLVFDEVFGFLPPHPANPPTKRPILALLKQARAFGVGLVLATQNPMDLDYKALSNAGVWFVGRLQTDADRERVVDGLAGSEGGGGGLSREALSGAIKALPPRTFLLRDVHHTPSSMLLETRWALSWLRGPMTRREIMQLSRSLGAKQGTSAQQGTSPQQGTSGGAARAGASVGTHGDGAREEGAARGAAPVPPDDSARATATPQKQTSTPAHAGPPGAPEGFRVFFAHAPTHGRAWHYAPWIAATAVAHVRDAKLGAAVNRTLVVAAPLDAAGRPDSARAANIDVSSLSNVPVAGAAFRAIPEALFKKAGQEAASKAIREHVYRTLEVSVDVHEGLGLVRGEAESREAFIERCQRETMRETASSEQGVIQKAAPKIAKLSDKLHTLQARLAGAEAELNNLPGAVTTALLGLAGGRGTVRQTESQRAKVGARIEKLRGEWHQADADLRAAVAERDAEIGLVRQAVARAASDIRTATLKPKKTDVEITALAIAWGVE